MSLSPALLEILTKLLPYLIELLKSIIPHMMQIAHEPGDSVTTAEHTQLAVEHLEALHTAIHTALGKDA